MRKKTNNDVTHSAYHLYFNNQLLRISKINKSEIRKGQQVNNSSNHDLQDTAAFQLEMTQE